MDLNKDGNEINPMIIELVKMVTEGMTDSEIGAVTGKSKQLIYQYRHKYGIQAGFKYRSKFKTAPQVTAMPQFMPLNQLCL